MAVQGLGSEMRDCGEGLVQFCRRMTAFCSSANILARRWPYRIVLGPEQDSRCDFSATSTSSAGASLVTVIPTPLSRQHESRDLTRDLAAAAHDAHLECRNRRRDAPFAATKLTRHRSRKHRPTRLN